MFSEFTWVWWSCCAVGGALGYLAARIRAVGTQFEGKAWVMLLGMVAGTVVGAAVFLANLLFATVFVLLPGWMSPVQVFAITTFVLGVLFAAFVLRRRYA